MNCFKRPPKSQAVEYGAIILGGLAGPYPFPLSCLAHSLTGAGRRGVNRFTEATERNKERERKMKRARDEERERERKMKREKQEERERKMKRAREEERDRERKMKRARKEERERERKMKRTIGEERERERKMMGARERTSLDAFLIPSYR